MIYIGIDDTDMEDSPGTNQLARRVVRALAGRCSVFGVTRHQLLVDDAIPYTSKNSSAAIMLHHAGGLGVDELARLTGPLVTEGSPLGSDPGLCIAADVPQEVIEFGRRAKREVLRQEGSHEVAARAGILLVELGGSGQGVVGALAAVGLASTGDDGRFVQLGGWPDDLSGPQPAAGLLARGVEQFLAESDGRAVRPDTLDIGKRLRPSYRGNRIVLHVRPTLAGWQAVRQD